MVASIITVVLLSGAIYGILTYINHLQKQISILLKKLSTAELNVRIYKNAFEGLAQSASKEQPSAKSTSKLSRKQKLINLSKNTDNPHEKELAAKIAREIK